MSGSADRRMDFLKRIEGSQLEIENLSEAVLVRRKEATYQRLSSYLELLQAMQKSSVEEKKSSTICEMRIIV